MQRTAQRSVARVWEGGEDRRDEALHVGRATTVEAVLDGHQPERIAAPLLTLDGDDIRVGGEQNSGLIGRAEHSMEVETVGA